MESHPTDVVDSAPKTGYLAGGRYHVGACFKNNEPDKQGVFVLGLLQVLVGTVFNVDGGLTFFKQIGFYRRWKEN